MARDWDVRAGELSAESYAQGEPTRWFDRLYAAGEAGEISMPWERDEPHRLLRLWTQAQALHGEGRRAVVVGCGLGADAEHLARLGFETVGFDVSGTAVRLARGRHPDTAVDYRVADLLDLPVQWRDAFDLVVEVFTVQALPDPPRAAAIRAVSTLVAPGGTLLAIAFRRVDGDDPDAGPPFPLDRATMDSLAGDHLRIFAAEELDGPLWRVVYDR
ncbi:MAG: class I SAM-dependent methyltransferase [Nocardioidaceae bacterium]